MSGWTTGDMLAELDAQGFDAVRGWTHDMPRLSVLQALFLIHTCKMQGAMIECGIAVMMKDRKRHEGAERVRLYRTAQLVQLIDLWSRLWPDVRGEDAIEPGSTQPHAEACSAARVKP
jgi:hypothetical protein